MMMRKLRTIVGNGLGGRPAVAKEGQEYFDVKSQKISTFTNGKWDDEPATTVEPECCGPEGCVIKFDDEPIPEEPIKADPAPKKKVTRKKAVKEK